MSWDVSINRFSRPYKTIDDIAEDEQGLPIGSQAEVREMISAVFGETNWNDPTWGIYDSPRGSIEFNMGDEEPCTNFMLHVRATDAIVPMIVGLCVNNQLQAIDCSNGEFLEQSESPADGLNAWIDYRNRVFQKS